jgi:hypothetical protein
MRDEFSRTVLDVLAKRVGFRCSNSDCRKLTTGPRTEVPHIVNIGVGAHITAAAPGGPRFNPALSAEVRGAADNGIWLCQNCSKLVDNDVVRYSSEILREWKARAEDRALAELEGRLAAPSGTVEHRVSSLTNQSSPARACIEFLRLENLYMPSEYMAGVFDAAVVMTDNAGERIGWDVLEITTGDLPSFLDAAARFASESSRLIQENNLGRVYLAAVAADAVSSEAETTATKVASLCEASCGKVGIKVLIGWMANRTFVNLVLTSA